MSNFRYALRALLRNATSTAVVVLTLAVAIGAATIIASTVDSVWHAIPASDTDRLVFIASTDPRPSQARAGMLDGVALTGTSVPDLVDFIERSTTAEQFAAFRYATATLKGLDAPERASLIRTTVNMPSLLGITPQIGRGFRNEDGLSRAAPVALLAHRYWRERFESDPTVVGTHVFLDGVPHTIVGVFPQTAGTGIFVEVDLWVPQPLEATRSARDDRGLFVMARLKPDVSSAQLAADLSTVAESLKREHPDTNAQTGVVVRPLIELLGGGIRFLLFLLALIAALVVAMACTNASNVVLAQVSARRRELSLRTALGAGRWDHVKQVMAEGFLVSASATAAGLILGAWGLAALKWIGGPEARVLTDAAVNGRIVAIGALTAFLIPFGFSLLPAVQSWRPDPSDLTHGARASRAPGHRTRTVLVALQVGLAVVMLVQVALIARMAWALKTTTLGFDPRQVLTLKMDLAADRFADPGSVTRFYSNLLARIAALPGVTSAGAINRLPVADRDLVARVQAAGAPPVAPETLPSLALGSISVDYLRTMRVSVERGRGLEAVDFSGGQPVALVSEDAARMLWPGGDPLGKRATFTLADEPQRSVLVVGVVANVRTSDVDRRTMPQIYVPSPLRPERSMAIAVRSDIPDPLQLAPAIRATAAELEPNEPIFAVSSMEQVLFSDLASTYILAGLLIAVGGVALCLAAAGTYGVISYFVVQRTREIGVRMALGAKPATVRRMIIAQGARPVVGGGLLGLPVALGLASMMASVFWFLPLGVTNYIPVLLAIGLVALAACYVPARRASRVDPVVALRQE